MRQRTGMRVGMAAAATGAETLAAEVIGRRV